mgnify:CR=1 FL=1
MTNRVSMGVDGGVDSRFKLVVDITGKTSGRVDGVDKFTYLF